MKIHISLCLLCCLAAQGVHAQGLITLKRILPPGVSALAEGKYLERSVLKTIPNRTTSTQSNPCNLVVNGDFETTNGSVSGHIENVQGPQAKYNELASWIATNNSSPDFYSTLAPPTTPSNPASATPGSFTPYTNITGATNGCLGLVGYFDWDDDGKKTYIEYATGLLTRQLDDKHSYYASMWVYAAGPAKIISPIGLDITPSPVTTTAGFRTFAQTGCHIQSNSAISGQQWQQVRGVFRGINGAKYINVGNFQNFPPQTTAGIPNPYGYRYNYSYQYIDNIEVLEIPSAGPPLANACNSSTGVIIGEGCDIPGATYAWTTGTSSAPIATTIQTQVNPTYTTTYTLTVTLPDGSLSTSAVTVTVASPTAGPDQIICPGQSVTLGEGCEVLGATYSWREQGSSYTFSSALHPSLIINQTTTYILTVNLPNGSSYISYVTVTVGIPMPVISLYGGLPNDCYRTNNFQIENFDPALTYTINEVSNARGLPVHPTTRFFKIAGVDNSNYTEYGYFTVTATGSCGTATTDVIEAVYPCSELANMRSSKAATAYPNPATETITAPAGAENVILLNDKGKTLRQADASGKLDVQSLPEGLYNLQMMQNGKLINQRIKVKH